MATVTVAAPMHLDLATIAAAVPKMLPQVGPSFYVITYGCPIMDSGAQTQRMFGQSHFWVGNIDTATHRLFISSQPYTPAPFIVDDGLFVNGNLHGGFSSVTVDPKRHLGEMPEVCYRGVDPIDVTNEVRRDGWLHIQLMDLGGYTFCASRLYLVVQSER